MKKPNLFSGRLARSFARLRSEGRAGFVPFLNFGDPEPSLTLPLLLYLLAAGLIVQAVFIGALAALLFRGLLRPEVRTYLSEP